MTRFGTRKAPYSIDGHYFVHSFLQMQRAAREEDKVKQSKVAAVRHALVNAQNQQDTCPKYLGR